jgi:hypothetical protein
MRNKLSIMAIVIMASILPSCYVRSKNYRLREKKKIVDCMSKWTYKDLQKEQEVRVLLFSSKRHYSLAFFPNFIIGLTETNDTIGFVDEDFDGKITKRSKIKIIPLDRIVVDKERIEPGLTVHNKVKENDLYCAVKEVYFGKIQLIEKR